MASHGFKVAKILWGVQRGISDRLANDPVLAAHPRGQLGLACGWYRPDSGLLQACSMVGLGVAGAGSEARVGLSK